MKKRIIAMVVSVAMMLTMFPTGVLADDFDYDEGNTAGVTVSAEGQSDENQGEGSDTAQVNVDEDEETQPETVQPENEQTEPEQTETDQAKPDQTETNQTEQTEPGSTVPDQAGTQPDNKQPEPEQPATDPAENGVSNGAESTEGEQAESKTEFTVTWESEGETILTKTFAKGTSKDEVENAQPAETPVKEADGDVAYEFAGWTPDYADVTADQTYTAKFEEAEQDEMVSTANLVEPADFKNQPVTLAVGDTKDLTGSDIYNQGDDHGWKSSDSDVVSFTTENNNKATVKANKVSSEPVTITHTYKQWKPGFLGFGGSWESHTDTWEITVNAPVAATGVELKTQDGKTGEAEVTEFQTLKLVATPVPNNATGTYQWHSDNDEILSVQGNGNEATVTGKVRNQSANITVQFTPTAGQVQQATIKIDVKPDEAHSSTAKALVYYLINPRGDVNSNNDELFGDRYGEVTVNTTGMVWNHNNGRNCTTSDVKNRVVEWPDGYKVVEPQSSHWYAIFNSYKATVEEELGVTIEEKDVEEIRIIPAKISQNNGTDPDYHVDCNVQIVCKKVATVRYYLQDVGDGAPQFLGSKNYVTGRETKPSDVTDKTFPGTKDQGGVTYTFKGWYTDPFFTNGPVSMPQTVNGSTDYYAKYVAGRSVTYDLDGGSWNLGSQNNWTEQVDEGFLYTVKGDESTQLQRTGYTFAGWKVDGESIDDKTVFNAGDKFTMPGRNVTLRAKWDKDATKTQDTKYTVKYTIDGVEQPKDTIEVKGTAWVNDDPAMIAIAEGGIPAPADKYKGYKLDEQNPEYPAEGEKVESGSVYTVNYVTDEAQTQPTQYTVKYTINGVEQPKDTIEVKGTAWVNDDPAMIAIAEGGIPAPADKYKGYKLDEQNPEYPAEGEKVESGSVYTVNYVTDEAQTQPTQYTVKYTINGVEQPKDTIEVKGTAWVNDDPAMIAIAEGGIPAPADKYKGYKLDEQNPEYPAEGEKVESGSVYTVNYVTDEAQTQPTQYTVKYTINGVEQPKDTIEVKGTAWVNDDPAMIAIAEGGIPAPADKYKGYKLDEQNPEYPAEGEKVESGSVYTVNYVTDEAQTQPTQYTVKYTINGVEQPKDTIEVKGTAWVNDDPAMIAIAEGGIPAPADKYKGYKLDEQNPEYPAEGEKVESGSVYTVNYVNRTDLSYTVHYYWKDTTDEVAPSKNVTDQTYGTTAAEKPIKVDGYTAVNPEEETKFSIGVTNEDVIFYYYKNVTVTADNKSKTYGDADPKLTATATDLVGEDTVDYTLNREPGEDVGEYAITVTGNEVQGNYKVSFINGDFEITPLDGIVVTITGHKETVTYDGEQHEVFGYDAVVNDTLYNLNTDIKFVGAETQDADVQGKDAGTYTMNLSAANFKNTNKNFANVTFNVTPGKLVIEQRKVTLESATDNKVYDGTPLTRPDVKITGSFVDGEVTDIHATGSVTNVSEGTVDNTITYTKGKNFNENNYWIVLKEGALHITPVTDEVSVTIKGNSDTVVYDGKQHSVDGYDIVSISNDLYHATDFVADENKGVSVSGTDAETYQMDLKPERFKNTNKNFANVEFVVEEDGKLVITPAPLKITTNSAEKTYDGSALTAGGKIEGLVKDETATLKTTGSQTEVGESKNTYEIEWGTAKETNYKIAEEDIGTLKVNARSGGGSSSKPTPEDEPTPTPTPTPLPTLPTTPAPTTPARRVTRSTATVTEPASRPTEQITENETPKAESEPEVIEDEETPLAPMAGGAWALVNLILMLLTVLASLLLLLGYLGKKKYAKEDEYGNALHDANGNEIIDYTRNKKGFWRVASLIPAIAAVIAFALTENMRLPMVMTDRWTLLMVIIAVVQLIVAVLCKKKKESEEDENQANA